jgi:hypothetical protein
MTEGLGIAGTVPFLGFFPLSIATMHVTFVHYHGFLLAFPSLTISDLRCLTAGPIALIL